ncbi:MAG: hemolysin family protein [Myxococcota bacterium]
MDDPSTAELIALASFGVVLASVFSAVSAGLVALGAAHLEALSEGADRDSRTAARVLELGPRMETRLFVGRVLFFAVAVVAAASLTHTFAGAALSAFGTSLAYSVIAEVLGGYVRRRASAVALPMLRFIRPLEMIVAVLSLPIEWLGAGTRDATPPVDAAPELAARAVEHLIEQGEEHGHIEEAQARLLYSVLEFNDTVAREVMVPRTRMQAFERSVSVEEALRRIESTGHSRYPVYRDAIDQIEGLLYAKDLFRLLRHGSDSDEPQRIDGLVRPVYFASEETKVGELLRDMQSKRFHLAVIHDEFGGVAGIVTLEDILEEIVGEIEDEHDDALPRIEALADDCWSVDAAMSVHDVQEAADVQLGAEESDFESIGGLVVHVAGGVPGVGDVVAYGDYELTVLAANERRVSRVELRCKQPSGTPST